MKQQIMLQQKPLITIVVPSLNQGQFLEKTLMSIFEQNIPLQAFVIDGGSTDRSIDIIRKWENKLTGWRSSTDMGQSYAINEGIELGNAPFVCWLNSDDWLLPASLGHLLKELLENPHIPAVYGRSWNFKQSNGKTTPVWVEPFSVNRLALRCIISQPATLIRRSVWNAVGGVDNSLDMAMDYDLWWKIFKKFGELKFLDKYIAVNRIHKQTKTNKERSRHYNEAIKIVRKYHGSVPIKWWLAQPYSVWYKSLWPF